MVGVVFAHFYWLFKKMSHSHGFQCPLHPLQLLSWLIYFCSLFLFYLVTLMHLQSKVSSLINLERLGYIRWSLSIPGLYLRCFNHQG